MWKDPTFYTNVLLSVLFISVFIGIFFFTYASLIEKRIVVKQTQGLVNDLTKGASVFLRDNPLLHNFVQNLSLGDMSREDQKVKQQNDQLLKKAGIVMGSFSLVLFLLSGILMVVFHLDYRKLILTNVIGLIVVAFVEFSFLTFIAQNYISFDPNYVKWVLVSELERFRNG